MAQKRNKETKQFLQETTQNEFFIKVPSFYTEEPYITLLKRFEQKLQELASRGVEIRGINIEWEKTKIIDSVVINN